MDNDDSFILKESAEMSRADSNFERFYFFSPSIFAFATEARIVRHMAAARRCSHNTFPVTHPWHQREAQIWPSSSKRGTQIPGRRSVNLVTAARRGTFGSRIRSAACLCGCRSRSREVGIVVPGAPNYQHLSVNGKTLQLCTLLRRPVGKQLTHGGNRGRWGGGTGDVRPSRGGVVRSPPPPPGLEDDRVTGSAGLHRRWGVWRGRGGWGAEPPRGAVAPASPSIPALELLRPVCQRLHTGGRILWTGDGLLAAAVLGCGFRVILFTWLPLFIILQESDFF